jgi:hypothetical protein
MATILSEMGHSLHDSFTWPAQLSSPSAQIRAATPQGPTVSLGAHAAEFPRKRAPAKYSHWIRKRWTTHRLRVPTPRTHDSGLGTDITEAMTPGQAQ